MIHIKAAQRKSCLQAASFVLVCACFLCIGSPPARAQQSATPQEKSANGQQPIIERIEFVGNRRVQRETMMADIFSRPGDPYSVAAVDRDFRALWNTQFFENIRLEVENSPDMPNGKIVVFYVTERPTIRNIHYKGNKSVTESDILDAFKDRKVDLTVESRFDPTKIKRAEVVIQQLLAEHGHMYATVKPTYERIPATNSVSLTFNIDEGPKVKVGRITITGNHAFSSVRIIRTMHNSRPIAIPLGFADINLFSKTYDRDKLDEDMAVGIQGLYQDHGYFRVLVAPSEPILKTVKTQHNGFLPGPWPLIGKYRTIRTDITIPIEEGAQYRMGRLIVRSANPDQNLYFNVKFLEDAFPIKKGQIFDTSKIRKAIKDYTQLYGDYGFIDFTANPSFDVDDATKTVNLTLDFDQQKQFFVHRIEFSGNTTTRDKVIRREILLDEGSLFNDRLWELSILRLNQLGYFDEIKKENADLKRNTKAGTVDINLKVHEKGKQNISFSGGVSGLAGTFLGLAYQTNNFLGLGETLTFSANFGSIERSILFGFTEPYLLDRPISTGFTIFSTKYNFNQEKQLSILVGQSVAINPALAQDYSQNSKGFTLFASYPLHRFAFTRVSLTYGWTKSDIQTFSQASQLLFQSIQFSSLRGSSQLNGIVSSKITPSITYNTVNNPTNPTGGKMFSFSTDFEGGPLQGNVNVIRNIFEAEYFHPTWHKRNVIGMRLISGWVTGYGGRLIPPYERFYIGGEDTVRGFDFFNISPWTFIPTAANQQVTFLDPTTLGPNGGPTPRTINVPVLEYYATRPGGDLQEVGNFEYRIPIAGPVSMNLFADVGLDGILRPSQLQLDPTATSQLNSEFPNPFFPSTSVSQKLSVVPGTNFKPRTSVGVEFVVFLPIVRAPFRFYYAYNPTRLNQTIAGQRGAYYLSPAELAALPPGVLQSQIIPALNQILDQQVQRFPTGLVEPRSTFRFTVGRTF
ncbi:MAG TPA: outer membrane protein assembly factor BamA [Candidatus Acidoferrales bacterium]|nr:outer membrane protein assembly factor BamA [Candidatus Acidoferrales bacterium]